MAFCWKIQCSISSQPLKRDSSKFANQRDSQKCQTLENLASSITSHCQFGFEWICGFGFGLVDLNPDLDLREKFGFGFDLDLDLS